MNQQNFFADLINRLFSGNPKFFKWIQLAAIVLGAASGIFSFLESQAVALPVWAHALSAGIVKLLAGLTILMAQLPNKNPVSPAEAPKS